MKTAVLVGFECFGQYSANATEDLATSLAGQIVCDHQIHSLVLPVAIFPPAPRDYGVEVVQLAMGVDASAIISLGMASDARGIRVEHQATNWVENEKYCHPDEHRRQIDNSLSATTVKKIDLDKWDLNKLRQQLETRNIPLEPEVSEDANRYCCNALIFRTLLAMERQRFFIPYLYLHIACTARAIASIPDFDPEKTTLTEQQLRDTISILLSCYH